MLIFLKVKGAVTFCEHLHVCEERAVLGTPWKYCVARHLLEETNNGTLRATALMAMMDPNVSQLHGVLGIVSIAVSTTRYFK